MISSEANLNSRQFLAEMAHLRAKLHQQIASDCDGFTDEGKAERLALGANDFAYFVRTYFPHYVKFSPSEFHKWLFHTVNTWFKPTKKSRKESINAVVAAPRGEAKSTLITQLLTIWLVVTDRKKYGILIADALDQAIPLLEGIKAEFEANPRLAMDYPGHCGMGNVWHVNVIVTAGGAKLEAAGSGKRLRGRRHGSRRPDFCIFDDLENDENVRNPAQREKVWDWLHKSVLNLGAQGEVLDVFGVGTVLHYDSVLARLLRSEHWQSAIFKSIIRWPDRMDLWEKWEQLFKTDGGKKAAQKFYDQNKADMECGAQVSWAAASPLLSLMTKRARNGHAAFDSEQQNDPVNLSDSPFGALQYWIDLPNDLVYYGAIDPSLGRQGGSGDPSAILIGGYQRTTGKLYVILADIGRKLPDVIIERAIHYQRQYQCVRWAIESVQFQAFFRTTAVKLSAMAGVPLPAIGVIPTTDKVLRIESLQPHTSNGLILFHQSQSVLLQQLRHFPKADHDDGPDALEMLYRLAVSGHNSSIRIGKPRNRTIFNGYPS